MGELIVTSGIPIRNCAVRGVKESPPLPVGLRRGFLPIERRPRGGVLTADDVASQQAARRVLAEFGRQKYDPGREIPRPGCADSVQVPGRFSAVVPAAEHRRECLDLFLAPALLARLFVITLGADALDDVLAVELLLHPAERAINRLVLANLDFDGHGFADVVWERKGSLGFPRKPTSNRIFPKRHRQRHPALLKVFPPEELPPPPTSPGRQDRKSVA